MRGVLAAGAALGLAACGPSHLDHGKPRTVTCLDGDRETGELTLTARRGGREVVVQAGPLTYALTYRRTRGLFIDEYAGDGARLTADPEVFFHPPYGRPLGPCGY
jgi:hypothetical protein